MSRIAIQEGPRTSEAINIRHMQRNGLLTPTGPTGESANSSPDRVWEAQHEPGECPEWHKFLDEMLGSDKGLIHEHIAALARSVDAINADADPMPDALLDAVNTEQHRREIDDAADELEAEKCRQILTTDSLISP
jgi:hypothetical protein